MKRVNKVVIGLSGGVDSSVAAYLLKQQGFEVIGLFMINWHDTTGTLSGSCTWNDDMTFAKLVARKLNIPLHIVDFSKQYRQQVVDYMFTEYNCGRTPNPDVLCNREIKFDRFADAAFRLGADFIATGHYCRKEILKTHDGKIHYRLLAGTDTNKDQSYFLCQLSQKQLSRALFPLGNLLKSEVREIAKQACLPTALRKDSQGLCFVGKIDLPVFLQQKIKSRTGNVIEISPDCPKLHCENAHYINHQTIEQDATPVCFSENDGVVIGNHPDSQFFTIGQRRGLNIGGRPEPLFVIATDVLKNVIYVGQGKNHPGLYRKVLFVGNQDIHWIRPDLTMELKSICRYDVRVRYRQPLQQATMFRYNEGIFIVFDTPQRGVAAGQFAAWYKNNELVGSGVIGS
jgi:tRNA-specific 2-thiouridylase